MKEDSKERDSSNDTSRVQIRKLKKRKIKRNLPQILKNYGMQPVEEDEFEAKTKRKMRL